MRRKISVPHRDVGKYVHESCGHDHEFLSRELKQGQPLAKNSSSVERASHGAEVITRIQCRFSSSPRHHQVADDDIILVAGAADEISGVFHPNLCTWRLTDSKVLL